MKEVLLDEERGRATVIVHDYQLSLAIGKEGQNARLAARLTGWHIDIKSESEAAAEEADYAEGEWAEGEWVEDESGEMVWKPAEGGETLSAEAWAAGEVPRNWWPEPWPRSWSRRSRSRELCRGGRGGGGDRGRGVEDAGEVETVEAAEELVAEAVEVAEELVAEAIEEAEELAAETPARSWPRSSRSSWPTACRQGRAEEQLAGARTRSGRGDRRTADDEAGR